MDFLVFEGGGIKGLAYCGALEGFPDLSMIKGFAGTSAGAIMAAFLATGISLSKIKEILLNTDFSKIIPTDAWRIPMLYNIFNTYGYMDDTNFMNFLKTALPRDYTLKELYDERQTVLITVGSNLNTRKPVYFNYENNPNMKVTEAVRISISIPFVFRPVNYENALYVDGGLGDNFPIDYIRNTTPPDTKILGMRLKCVCDAHYDINNIGDFVTSLLSITKDDSTQDLSILNIIITSDIQGFALSESQKTMLLEAGRQAYLRFHK